MWSYVLWLMLGVGGGATYAVLGQGLVLKYRSAGVVDFAHGAVAMFIAYVFVNLRSFGQLELPVVLIPHQISLNGGGGRNTPLARLTPLGYPAAPPRLPCTRPSPPPPAAPRRPPRRPARGALPGPRPRP